MSCISLPGASAAAPLAAMTATAPGRWRQAAGWIGGWLALALLCLTLSCLAGAAAPQAPAVQQVERSVKSAFLYKFLGYVDFPDAPETAAAPLTVGVLAADDIAAELARITLGRSVHGRAVAVRVLKDGDTPAGLHMLFVGADAGRAGAMLRAAQQANVLTVTETDNGLQQGGVINFRLVDDRVRFEVSLAAAERSGLKLSSRLLSVAYAVQKGGQ